MLSLNYEYIDIESINDEKVDYNFKFYKKGYNFNQVKESVAIETNNVAVDVTIHPKNSKSDFLSCTLHVEKDYIEMMSNSNSDKDIKSLFSQIQEWIEDDLVYCIKDNCLMYKA